MTKSLSGHFTKEAIRIANTCIKRWFDIISHEENTNQTHKYQCTPTRTATTKKTIPSAPKDTEQLGHFWWGCKNGTAAPENGLAISYKARYDLP